MNFRPLLLLLLQAASLAVLAQSQATVSGTVRTGDNEVAPDVLITLVGGKTVAQTDDDGRYAIAVPSGPAWLLFRQVGMDTTITLTLAKVLPRSVNLPALDLPTDLSVKVDEPLQSAEDAARRARQYFGLGTGPVPNVVRLLESRGIVCTRLPAQTRRVFAFSCSFPERPVVVLSAERSHRAASRFDAAHELGHLILHPDEEPGSHAVERQANAFAAEFLAPASEIADALPRRADWLQLLELKSIWGISIQALLYRARSLGVMPEHIYRRTVTELNARGWCTQEPGDDGNAEEPVLLAKAFALAEQRGITLDDVAAMARIPLEDARLIACVDERPRVDL